MTDAESPGHTQQSENADWIAVQIGGLVMIGAAMLISGMYSLHAGPRAWLPVTDEVFRWIATAEALVGGAIIAVYVFQVVKANWSWYYGL